MIDIRGLMNLLQDLDEQTWTKQRVRALYRHLDVDRSGGIDFEEFLNWIFEAQADPDRNAILAHRADFKLKDTDVEAWKDVQC